MSPTTQPPAEPGPAQEPDEAEIRSREAGEMDATMWSIVGHMAASLLLYGGLGYVLGRWLGHPILLLFGVLFGMTVSLVYTIWMANRGNRQG